MESLLTNTATIENTSMIRTKILVPTGVTNTFLTSKRGKPLYCNKKWPKIIWSQTLRYREVPMYIHPDEANTSCTLRAHTSC